MHDFSIDRSWLDEVVREARLGLPCKGQEDGCISLS